MHHPDQAVQACIEACLQCYRTCLGMATNHCLSLGGEHSSPAHIQRMLACAETCRATAHVMLVGSAHYRRLCAVCAEICDDCAGACARIGDMADCVQACSRCSESCRGMTD